MKKFLIIFLLIMVIFPWCSRTRTTVQTDSPRLIEFTQGGRSRRCLLHVPGDASGRSRPLLIVLHGGGGTPEGMVRLTKNRFNELADASGFFVAYPGGLGRSWNDFRDDAKGYAHSQKIDDVGFISALIERLAAEYPIDRGRVFATGISNGGFMSYRLACELSGKIRGIAAVTATNTPDQASKCAPARQVSVMVINGTEDPIVPYNGGEVKLLGGSRGAVASTDDTIRFWTRLNKCEDKPAVEELPDSDPADNTRVKKISYGPCGGGSRVVLYRVEGGGHTWPGGLQYLFTRVIGYTSRDMNACDRISEFFNLTEK
jgi:polyhydroxybutyrate depolymerase